MHGANHSVRHAAYNCLTQFTLAQLRQQTEFFRFGGGLVTTTMARRERLNLQRQQTTMCTGWPSWCCCPKHPSLYDRYERALVLDDEHAARLLQSEIETQHATLARGTGAQRV